LEGSLQGGFKVKVSVVIPTYNRAYIIRDALESALAQTYQDIEIIVLDDGSTDNTSEIVTSYKSDKIRYLRHEVNRGCSAACNSCIAAATGDLIAFLDSDDLWKPDKVERQVDFLLRHPEVDAVFCDVEIMTESGMIASLMRLMKQFPQVLAGNDVKEEYVLSGREMYICLLQEVPIKPTALLSTRDIYKRCGTFDESWPSGTDWDLFLRFAQSGSFGYIDRPLAVQRRTPDATHMKFREKDKLFLLSLFLKEKEKLKNDPEGLAAVNKGIASHCNDLGWDYVHTGEKKKAFTAYLTGFKETREPAMLAKAAAVLLPLDLRNVIGRTLRR
jgi:glycosyltransferase involved in cell wall biosynthesis